MSKILVTGGAGFIGSNFCNMMAEKGHRITAFDDLSLGKTESLSKKARFVKGNVNKKEDLKKAGSDFDYIVHLAASSSAPMFAKDMYYAYQNNVAGHIAVMLWAREIGAKKMLFASTSSIYGNNPTPLTEDQEVIPPNHYSVTKMAQEGASRVYSKAEGLEIIAFRFMSIYGLNEEHKTTFANLVSQFIWGMAKDEEPILYGDGTQERDFTNVKDVVQGIELAMNSPKKYGFTVFNIGTNKCINLIELVKLINKVMGKKTRPKFIPNPVKEGYVKSQLADITKISKELGYKPRVELEDGIREIVENLAKRDSKSCHRL
ncbi:MAG: NAD-dependent epimerase/dehydratase family protein [Candidatus Berkelbacteria bacterium]|nr:NAD-dependent epimerase/dehydratase family protein [Candidatus Berkelbacteria bacterium]